MTDTPLCAPAGTAEIVRLTSVDTAEFAAATGDRNPLHLDERHARRTAYGRCTVPGVLAAVTALGVLPAERVRTAAAVDVRFARPIFTDRLYRAAVTVTDTAATTILTEGGLPVLVVAATAGEPDGPVLAELDPPATAPASRLPEEPQVISRGDRHATGYAVPDPPALRALADRVGAAAVPDGLLGALGFASWFTGMRVPGRERLLAGLRLRAVPGSGGCSGTAEVTVSAADPHTGAVVLDGRLGPSATAAARLTVRAFRSGRVPPPDPDELAGHLAPSAALAGTTVLAVGGSRGIGAAIAATLAGQGATVWATRRDPAGGDAAGIHPVQLDATDPAGICSALRRVAAEAGPLDGVVLSAGPAVLPLRLHPDTVDVVRDFVDSSVTLALRPLAALVEAGDLLRPGAWLVLLSSGAVDDVPDDHPHYVMAKAAVEALGRYGAERLGLRLLVVRAPRMWTDLSNGPLGRRGTVPTGQVAAAVVARLVANLPAGVTVLGPDELTRSAR